MNNTNPLRTSPTQTTKFARRCPYSSLMKSRNASPGATFVDPNYDWFDDADEKVKKWLGARADVVMSDMAAASSGHKGTDHLRIVALCEAAAYFAFDVLEEGGTFVAKVLAGGAENELQALLKRAFTKVANVKPPASRADSSEKFVVATGFRGVPEDDAADDSVSGLL